MANNVRDLYALLTDPAVSTFTSETCEVLVDPPDATALLNAVTRAATTANDVLLVYFSGHGLLLGGDRDLYLTSAGATGDRTTSVPYGYIADEVRNSRAAVKIVILDCCFSGRAHAAPIVSSGVGGPAIEGVYVVTSSPGTKKSKFLTGAPNTVFTGALLEAMRNGLPDGRVHLSMAALFEQVRVALDVNRHPPPQALGSNTAGSMPLVRNATPGVDGAGQLSGEVRAYLRQELPKAVRSELEQLRAAVVQEARHGQLSGSAQRALWEAVAAVPPVAPDELAVIWSRAVEFLDPPPPSGRFTNYVELLRSADAVVASGDSAGHPVYRCVEQIVDRFNGRPQAAQLAKWIRHHRPGSTGKPGPDRKVGRSAIVVLMAPSGAAREGREPKYDLTVWLWTDVDEFTVWYPDAGRYSPAEPVTVKEAPATLAPVVFDALDRVARTSGQPGSPPPLVEFVLPEALWDLAVEDWRIGPNKSRIGLQYPVIVRSLDRLYAVESHQRWLEQWSAMLSQITRGHRVQIICRSCHATMDILTFQDFLHGLDQHGAIVLLEHRAAVRRNRAAMQAGMVAGTPGFLMLRSRSHPAGAPCAGPRLHQAMSRRLHAATPDDIPHATLALRRSGKPPFDQGFVLVWEDPDRRPQIHAPFIAPSAAGALHHEEAV